MRKKGFTLVEMIAVVIIIAIVAILAVPSILKSIRDSKQEISEAMEKVIFSAADNYMDLDKYVYEKYNGNRYCITLKQLVESENLANPIYDPINSQEISQDKFVQVDIFNDTYSYKVVDSCQEIDLRTLAGRLKQQYKEGNTTGLLKDNDGSYYFKGTNEEVANNFVWFGGHLWRVISIDNDDNLTMITQQPITAIQPANNVWTTGTEYETSYINHWLNSEEDGVFLKSMEQDDKDKILNNTFNIGIYTNISEITINQKVGLLDDIQYVKAGWVDSFLDIKDCWWIGNPYDTLNVRGVNCAGNLYATAPQYTCGVRPVIKILNLTNIEGNGTLTIPYQESSATTNTSNIKVGEYISIPTTGTDCGTDKKCLFRVVSKDNDSIKVILNGLLPTESRFGSTTTYTSGNTVDVEVKAFAETINSKYHYAGTDKTFGIGAYPNRENYIAVQGIRYTGNVGLPVVGEMFSGNDIDVTPTSKTFVNVATIENPTVSYSFWSMNAHSDSNVRRFDTDGNLHYNGLSIACGVRPVLFLKNNLTFTGGEGTAENPFTLE